MEKSTQRECAQCGKPITRKPTRGPKPKYCGKPCAILADTDRRRKAGTAKARSYTTPGTCPACGTVFIGKARQVYCTSLCSRRAVIVDRIVENTGRSRKSTALAVRVLPRRWFGSHTQGVTWTQGACAYCTHPFLAKGRGARYCSPRCSTNAAWQRRYRRYGEFTLSPRQRLDLYARDDWTCQLCQRPVPDDVHYQHDLAPSLDHIIPQSHTLIPDHSEANLRLAHRVCNSRRGNRLETV